METRSAEGGDQTSVRMAFVTMTADAAVGSTVLIAITCKSGFGDALETPSAKVGVECAQSGLAGWCWWQGGSAAFGAFQGQRPAAHNATHCALKIASAIIASRAILPITFGTLNARLAHVVRTHAAAPVISLKSIPSSGPRARATVTYV
jgi:hypothetical protein